MTAPLFVREALPSGRYRYKPADPEVICWTAAALVEPQRGDMLASPRACRDWLRTRYARAESEVFGVILLDNRHRVIEHRELFHGTIDGASVYPREVVKTVLKVNAAAIILYHNHPSGMAEPSAADRAITLRLRDALALIDVRVLDHLIVGGRDVTSLAEAGVLP